MPPTISPPRSRSDRPAIIIIAAVADDGSIGDGRRMLWHLPADLRWLKRRTMGRPLIMGLHTYEAIGRPLEGRITIRLSRRRDKPPAGIIAAASLEEALDAAARHAGDHGEIIIFGGGDVYRQAIAFADRMEITKVHVAPAGAVRFPPIDPDTWVETKRENHPAGADGAPAHSHVVLERRSNAPGARPENFVPARAIC